MRNVGLVPMSREEEDVEVWGGVVVGGAAMDGVRVGGGCESTDGEALVAGGAAVGTVLPETPPVV